MCQFALEFELAVATPVAKPAATSRRVLKIVSKCSTEAEFIAVFQRFCADDSLFVVTRTPKPVGASSRLSITLADGKPMLVGAGRVVNSFKGQDNEFKRPGMRLALSDLDPDSRETMARLNAAKQQVAQRSNGSAGAKSGNGVGDKPAAGKSTRATIMAPAVPPPLSRPPMKIPNIPRVGPKVRPEATPVPERIAPQESEPVTDVVEAGAPPLPRAPLGGGAVPQPIHDVPLIETPGSGDDEVTQVSADTEAKRAGTEETRAEGSDFILPANPFGELTDANLEAFVECTLYEETGSISLDEAEAADQADAEGDDEQTEGDLPPWWPQQQSGDGSHTPLPPAAPGMLPPDTTQEVHLRGVPAPQAQQGAPGPQPMMGQPGTPMAGPAGAPRMRAMTPAPMMAPAAPDPNLLTPFPGAIRRQRSWIPLAVTAGITAALTLIIGYVLWGSGSSAPKKSAPTPAPAVAPEKAPEKAPAPDTAPQEPPAVPEKATDTGTAPDKATEAAPEKATEAEAAPEKTTEAADDTASADDGNAEEPEAATTDGAGTTAAVPAGACVLTVSSNADNAMAIVNGKRIGRVPLSKEVPCGARKLTLEHPRYETRSLPLHLQEGESKISALMHRPIVQIKVLSRPSGATVTVDGHQVGNSPVSTKVRGFLYVTVKVSKAGYKPYTKRVYAKSKSTTIRARLTR